MSGISGKFFWHKKHQILYLNITILQYGIMRTIFGLKIPQLEIREFMKLRRSKFDGDEERHL